MGLGPCCGAQAEVRTLSLCARGPGRGRGGSGRAGAGARGWGPDSRGAGAWTHAGPPRSCYHRSLDCPLPVWASGRGRHDGPGPQPFRAAVGDFGRPFRLPWRADRRLPDSDQVRPAGGMGWGALAGLGEEVVRVGTRSEFVYFGSLVAAGTPGCGVLGDVHGCGYCCP